MSTTDKDALVIKIEGGRVFRIEFVQPEWHDATPFSKPLRTTGTNESSREPQERKDEQ